MDKIISLDCQDYVKYIISPITPYLICDHYFSNEISQTSGKYIGKYISDRHIDINSLRSKLPNNLCKNNNFDKINKGDIVQVQVDLFESFVNNILPKINTNIVLITSQQHVPQIFRSKITDDCLKNDKIILWISTNPIYNNNNKYMGFPIGINQKNINRYMNYQKKNNKLILDTNTKKNYLYNSHIGRHPGLPKNHIRYNPIFNSVCKRIYHTEYLDNILKSKFTISTDGDRLDCYRHYECIGLNSIPISNVNLKDIFGNNMIHLDINDIIKIINGEKNINYYKINRDILTIEYWKNKIKQRLLFF